MTSLNLGDAPSQRDAPRLADEIPARADVQPAFADQSASATERLGRDAPPSEVRAWIAATPRALGVYWVTTAIVFLGVLVGVQLIDPAGRHDSPRRIPPSGNAFLEGASQWDGQWLLQIAWRGYSYDPGRQSSVAFFPLYPALVAALFHATHMPIELAGLLVAHAALAAAFVVFTRYVAQRHGGVEGHRIGPYALLALGLFPTTFFMRMAYSESTILFLSLLVFYGIARGWRPVVLAMLVGLATAARPVGIALIPPLVVHAWRRSPEVSAAARQAAWLVPLSTWGLMAYLAYQAAAFGTPWAFAQTQSHWCDRPPFGALDRGIALVALEPIWSGYWPSSPGYCGKFAPELPAWCDLQMANPIWFLAAAALVAWGAGKGWLNLEETLMAAGFLLIPYATRGFEMCMASQGRFASIVFPTYLVLGRMAAAAPRVVVVSLAALMAVCAALYAAVFAAGFVAI